MEKIHIYNNPPDGERLREFASLHDEGIQGLVSTRGRKYRELGLADRKVEDEEWYELINEEPRLLRRPLLTDGSRVIVGFDKDLYEELVTGS